MVQQFLEMSPYAAIRKEPGALVLYAVSEKDEPNHVKVFEIYRDKKAYEAHLESDHFKKYKATVENMEVAEVGTDDPDSAPCEIEAWRCRLDGPYPSMPLPSRAEAAERSAITSVMASGVSSGRVGSIRCRVSSVTGLSHLNTIY